MPANNRREDSESFLSQMEAGCSLITNGFGPGSDQLLQRGYDQCEATWLPPGSADCRCGHSYVAAMEGIRGGEDLLGPVNLPELDTLQHCPDSCCSCSSRVTTSRQLKVTHLELQKLSKHLEEIAELRHRMTGAAYTTTTLPGKHKKGPPASREVERALAGHIAGAIEGANVHLLALHERCLTLSMRVSADGERSSDQIWQLQEALTPVKSTFADMLEFFQERAVEEKRNIADGKSGTRLQQRIEEEHPTWYRNKTLQQLRSAASDSQWQTFARVEVSEACGTFSRRPAADRYRPPQMHSRGRTRTGGWLNIPSCNSTGERYRLIKRVPTAGKQAHSSKSHSFRKC